LTRITPSESLPTPPNEPNAGLPAKAIDIRSADCTTKPLSGKVAIVTGASTGIGKRIAEYLGRAGAQVVIDYVGHLQGALDAQQEAGSKFASARMIRADITNNEDRNRLVDFAWEQFGFADVLVNNAGIEIRSDFWDVSEEDFDKVLNVNLRGAFFLTQAFVRRLREAKKPGRIINISSVHEDMAFPGFCSYCCSKGALRMMARNLAVELGPLGITINNIAPGAIKTPINRALLEDPPKLNALLAKIPLNRLGTPDDIAPMVAFLASDEAAYVTGSTFIVDGGLMRNYREQ
jgi:glucose 1-dehydrogenase